MLSDGGAMVLQLPALEKNILKYRALQMILMLHEVESLRKYIVESIRATDSIFQQPPRLPPNGKRTFETALGILVTDGVISEADSQKVSELVEFRNRIGHHVHQLVADISELSPYHKYPCLHDYNAVQEVERLRSKIGTGMQSRYVQSVSLAPLIFEQAELAYKEELGRLERKIGRQIAVRTSVPPREDDNGQVSEFG